MPYSAINSAINHRDPLELIELHKVRHRLLIRRLITGIPSSSSSCTKYGIIDHCVGMNLLRTSTGIAEMYASATTTEPSRICEISPRYIAEMHVAERCG